MMAGNGVMKGNVNQSLSDASGQPGNATGADADAVALQLKKQARRRLIGAIALALFGVITLPMVMDSQPRPVAPEIQVHIPSQDGSGFAAKPNQGAATKQPLSATGGPNKTETAAAVNSAIKESSLAESAANSPPAKELETKTVAETLPVAATQKPSTADSPAADKALGAKTKTSATKPPEPPKKSTDPTAIQSQPTDEPRALAVLTGTESLSAPWMVQLGAYKEAGNVRVLMTKVKEMKIPVTSEKFESTQGPRVRVKAGPFATRADAEKAQARIRTIGVVGVLSQ